jgi:hypothetical protein
LISFVASFFLLQKALPFPFSHQREIGYYLMSEISSAVFRKDQELYKLSLELEVRERKKNWGRFSSITAARAQLSTKDGTMGFFLCF